MMKKVMFALLLTTTSAYAQNAPHPPDRTTLTLQAQSAQIQALSGANQICQMDVADLKKQLDEARAELAKQKPAEQKK